MSDRINELLLAALQSSAKPIPGSDVLDAAIGMGMAEGWTPDQLKGVTRRSVAGRLQQMVTAGLARVAGSVMDHDARRTTPAYEPVERPAKVSVPPPPAMAVASSSRTSSAALHGDRPRAQLLALLDAQDEMLTAVGRFLQDLERARDRCRAKLIATGVEV